MSDQETDDALRRLMGELPVSASSSAAAPAADLGAFGIGAFAEASHSEGPGRRHMCLEFLDSGTCSKGQSCPFAHRPAELEGRSARPIEDYLRKGSRANP